MRALIDALSGLPEFCEAASRVKNGETPVAVSGLAPIHRAHFAAAVHRLLKKPVFVLCAEEDDAARACADISSFTEEEAVLLPPRELTLLEAEAASREWEQKRLSALYRMAAGAPVTVSSVDAALMRAAPPDAVKSSAVELRTGLEISIERVTELLVASGYRRFELVEGRGQLARRGGILDFFSPGSSNPVRIEFYGDEIDTVSSFDIDTQRRVESLQSAMILPVAEALPGLAEGGVDALGAAMEGLKAASKRRKAGHLLSKTVDHDIERLRTQGLFAPLDRYLPLIFPRFACAADYIPKDAAVLIFDNGRVSERAKAYAWQMGRDIEELLESGTLAPECAELYCTLEGFLASLSGRPVLMLDSFVGSKYSVPPKSIVSATAKQLPSYGGSLETAMGDLRHYHSEGYRTVVLCGARRRADHLMQILSEGGVAASVTENLEALPEQGGAFLAFGSVSAGMEYPGLKLAVLTEGQLVQEHAKKARKVKKKSARERVSSYADLAPGDYVVHEHHGIGRFTGIVKMPSDGFEKDYIRLAYSGSDALYVPVTQLDLVSKYIGAGMDASVRLNRLGGVDWQRAKSKAKGAAKELARELIELYARRLRQEGHAFPPDSDWQLEFEESFDFEETEDQLRSAREIKADMESPHPMDRLLCGDVGFGKTEVALRAVMKCVLAGKQAAMLVPTTVLAQQHYQTALRRFKGYPIEFDVLSRFKSPVRVKETLSRLRAGTTDFIIGTHKLLQKGIEFKDLGLLIIDEEQRFGVTHKERLKEMSQMVDVLTLTATPIPRTLNMALSGIRDMSSLEEAPRDRRPVQTFVLEHNMGVLADAIRREVSRGGQVYYLHNRVETIDRTAFRLQEMLGEERRVAVAHGKMTERELGMIMNDMTEGNIDVLVCTTIIETGIDIPNVNTLIVEDADRLGLSQLHQIRGRVGRSPRHAYAYLTYRHGKVLTEIAEKRLSAVREFAEFGAGFKIAMRDLEIRGAGNILGPQQSGQMMSVGYDMYLRLLEEAVLEEKGEPAPERVECSADFAVDAGIPEKYIASCEQRLDLYRRIAMIKTRDDASELIDELCDRYGDVPAGVHALMRIALLRAEAAEVGVTEINQRDGKLIIKLKNPDVGRLLALCSEQRYRKRVLFSAGESPYITLRLEDDGPLEEAECFVAELAR